MAVCSTCQNTVPDHVKFCPVCGRYLRGTFTHGLPGMPAPSGLQDLQPPPPSPPAPAELQGSFEAPLPRSSSQPLASAVPAAVYAPRPPSPPPSKLDALDGFVQLHRVIEPFGEINVRTLPDLWQIRATLMEYEVRENTRTALALDGSLSMKKLYGQGAATQSFFASAQKATNDVQPIARKMARFLSETVDCTGRTMLLYWACGALGAEVEAIGDLDPQGAEAYAFSGPQHFGKGTRLLPPLRAFVEQTASYPFRIFVILTDGRFDDLEEVKGYTQELVRAIQGGQIRPLKFVLLGLGPEVEESQMIELDDLETGTEIDLWDHKLAQDLRQMWDIFAEVVDRNKILAPWGRIYDQKGRILKEYPHGLPAVLAFDIPTDVTGISLEIPGQRTPLQPLS